MTRMLRRLLAAGIGYVTLSCITATAATLVAGQVNQIVVAKFEKLEAAINRFR